MSQYTMFALMMVGAVLLGAALINYLLLPLWLIVKCAVGWHRWQHTLEQWMFNVFDEGNYSQGENAGANKFRPRHRVCRHCKRKQEYCLSLTDFQVDWHDEIAGD